MQLYALFFAVRSVRSLFFGKAFVTEVWYFARDDEPLGASWAATILFQVSPGSTPCFLAIQKFLMLFSKLQIAPIIWRRPDSTPLAALMLLQTCKSFTVLATMYSNTWPWGRDLVESC